MKRTPYDTENFSPLSNYKNKSDGQTRAIKMSPSGGGHEKTLTYMNKTERNIIQK